MNVQQLRNSIAIIKQIKRGEWRFEGHYKYDFKPEFTCYTAVRNDVELWVANGMMSCGIRDKYQECGVFGALIWVFAAKKEVRLLEKRMYRKTSDLTK